ncbi:hypothetical protein [Lutibacter sp.]|uniref:hypothetical protein n=1 Tax=Lutibacter sp. TaxID=1925666 RepID=UPI001A2C21BD|nr:hypothetical protein [Lutibacter sp.]MBI9041335.1 hypothetical protein [Lutibacter sp.]
MKKDRKKTEICIQCNEAYIPTRIGVQKFCSASCRSRYWFVHNQKSTLPSKALSKNSDLLEKQPVVSDQKPTKKENISGTGVATSALGAIIANAVTGIAVKVLRTEKDEPATKGDLINLENMIASRYFEVHNISRDLYGRIPYFDMSTSKIVYYDEYQNTFIYPQYDLH